MHKLVIPVSTLRDKQLTPRALQILLLGLTESPCSVADLAQATEVDQGTVYVGLRVLHKAGYAHRGRFYGSWTFSDTPQVAS